MPNGDAGRARAFPRPRGWSGQRGWGNAREEGADPDEAHMSEVQAGPGSRREDGDLPQLPNGAPAVRRLQPVRRPALGLQGLEPPDQYQRRELPHLLGSQHLLPRVRSQHTAGRVARKLGQRRAATSRTRRGAVLGARPRGIKNTSRPALIETREFAGRVRDVRWSPVTSPGRSGWQWRKRLQDAQAAQE